MDTCLQTSIPYTTRYMKGEVAEGRVTDARSPAVPAGGKHSEHSTMRTSRRSSSGTRIRRIEQRLDYLADELGRIETTSKA